MLLEGYPNIATQVGASIGVLANGLRILDQLGCCDEVVEMAEYSVEKVVFRDSSGHSFRSFKGFGTEIVTRSVLHLYIYYNHEFPVYSLQTWLSYRLP